ncbi:MAG TPA: phage Gp37/Gp68 family protein [Paraburkholderia sp.]
MADTTIEWTDAVWNPLRGCTRISAGCMNCYAERVAMRFSGEGQPYHGLVQMTSQGPKWTGRIELVPEKLEEPLRMRKPRKFFVNSMSDLFHEGVPFEFIDQVFAVMAVTRRHTYQILTKRADRMLEYFSRPGDRTLGGMPFSIINAAVKLGPDGQDNCGPAWPLENVWLGVSAEDQTRADERIPLLLQCPAAVHWISGEPLLGSIDLERVKWPDLGDHRVDVLRGGYWNKAPYLLGAPSAGLGEPKGGFTNHSDMPGKLNWVVAGGESGPGARPMHPDWARNLRDQCEAAGVRYFFKQHGEWAPGSGDFGARKFETAAIACDGRVVTDGYDAVGYPPGATSADGWAMVHRAGKKAAGRLLDGRTHDEFPEIQG